MKNIYSILLLVLALTFAGCKENNAVSSNNNDLTGYYYAVTFNGKNITLKENPYAYTGAGLSYGQKGSDSNDKMMCIFQSSYFEKVDMSTMTNTRYFGITLSKTVKEFYDSLDIVSIFITKNQSFGNYDKSIDGAEVYIYDDNGNLWSSSLEPGTQGTSSYFKIDELTYKGASYQDESIFSIKASFKCTLYNSKGQSAPIEGICRTRICVIDY